MADQVSPSGLRATAPSFIMPGTDTQEPPRLCFTPTLRPERRNHPSIASNLRADAPWFKPRRFTPIIVSSDMEPPVANSASSEQSLSDSKQIVQPIPTRSWRSKVRSLVENFTTPIPPDLTMDCLFASMGLRAPFTVPLIPSGLITQMDSPKEVQHSPATSPTRQDSSLGPPTLQIARASPQEQADSEVLRTQVLEMSESQQEVEHSLASTNTVRQVEVTGWPVVIANFDPQVELYTITGKIIQLHGRRGLRFEVGQDSQSQDILTVFYDTEEAAAQARRALSGETFGGNSRAIVYQLPRDTTVYQLPVLELPASSASAIVDS